MKKARFTFLCMAMVTVMTMNAQKVALHSSSGVQIFNGSYAFTNAYNASNSGDTIYLSGGTLYSPGNINKKLFIFGAGHYQDSTQATGKTIINGDIYIKDNTSGTNIEGIDLTGSVYFNCSTVDTIKNVTLSYAKISGNLQLGNNSNTYSLNFVLIRSVIMGSVDFSRASNAAVFNSFICGSISNSNGVAFENNILFYSTNISYNNYTVVGDNNTLKNNIFFSQYTYSGVTGNGNQFINNVFTKTPYYGNSYNAVGNYYPINADTLFINNTLYTFDYSSNYHLRHSNLYPGVDGSQAGLYGGTFPYKNGAVPSNPHIQLKNIAPASDNTGHLQIEFKINAQDE